MYSVHHWYVHTMYTTGIIISTCTCTCTILTNTSTCTYTILYYMNISVFDKLIYMYKNKFQMTDCPSSHI